MPGYHVLLSKQAYKFINELNKRQARRVTKDLGDLRNYPFFDVPHDIAKIKGRDGYYRIRIGDIRIILRIFDEGKEIYIEKIDYRSRVYK
jgi:mRNA-degrading endonuclease RelE of RelBE toxin-antitoxin system